MGHGKDEGCNLRGKLLEVQSLASRDRDSCIFQKRRVVAHVVRGNLGRAAPDQPLKF